MNRCVIVCKNALRLSVLEASGESGECRFQTEGGATAAAGEMENESSIIDNLLAVCISVCVCVFEAEVDSLRAENSGLKSAESQVVMTMRQNAQVASDYLNKMASHAHSSIRSVPADTHSHQPQHQAVNAAALSLSPVSRPPVSLLPVSLSHLSLSHLSLTHLCLSHPSLQAAAGGSRDSAFGVSAAAVHR